MTIAVNVLYVLKLLGWLMGVLSLTMVFPLSYGAYEHYIRHTGGQSVEALRSLMISVLVGGGLACVLHLVGRRAKPFLAHREALLLVSLSWVFGALVAALPFWIWGNLHPYLPGQDPAFRSLINCYFEAMSGLTTTGATVLTNIESIPRELLLWRSSTHWLGGLGIVVIFVALLPGLKGAGTRKLFSVETTGIAGDGVTPHIRDTARALLWIYLGLTALQTILLRLVDDEMTWFLAINHTFSTLATGGFSTLNSSAGALSPAAQWVISAFMLIAGINFALYHQAFLGNWRQILRNSEAQLYLSLVFIASLVLAFSLKGSTYHLSTGGLADQTWGQTIRDSVFQALSIITTTGYVSANFEEWGLLSKAVLVGLMITGGSGGSTAGGIKLIRILSVVKILMAELEKSFRPNVVRSIKVDNHTIDISSRNSVLAYVLGILFLFAVGAGLLVIFEPDIDATTALSASLASLNNIGPGFGGVGAVENFGWFTGQSKLVLCLLMALGRLEIFAITVIFLPKFWRIH